MKIYKETEIKNPLYIARLENDVYISVYDGYAEGSDGNFYTPAVREIDDELEILGWLKKKKAFR